MAGVHREQYPIHSAVTQGMCAGQEVASTSLIWQGVCAGKEVHTRHLHRWCAGQQGATAGYVSVSVRSVTISSTTFPDRPLTLHTRPVALHVRPLFALCSAWREAGPYGPCWEWREHRTAPVAQTQEEHLQDLQDLQDL